VPTCASCRNFLDTRVCGQLRSTLTSARSTYAPYTRRRIRVRERNGRVEPRPG
jgi:hypothetical protein